MRKQSAMPQHTPPASMVEKIGKACTETHNSRVSLGAHPKRIRGAAQPGAATGAGFRGFTARPTSQDPCANAWYARVHTGTARKL